MPIKRKREERRRGEERRKGGSFWFCNSKLKKGKEEGRYCK
jgi:hypothetical protein